jgi:hypothetical protein
MDVFKELFNAILPSLIEIITIVLGTLAGYLGIILNKWLKERTMLVQQQFKREQWELVERIISRTVQYVEQIAKEMEGQKKLELAKRKIIMLATEQGIELTEEQLVVVTEALVNSLFPHVQEVIDDLTDGVVLPLEVSDETS